VAGGAAGGVGGGAREGARREEVPRWSELCGIGRVAVNFGIRHAAVTVMLSSAVSSPPRT
jgi:hypothetical protein